MNEQKLNLFEHEVSVIDWMMDIQRSLIEKMLEASETAAESSASERKEVWDRSRKPVVDIDSILQSSSSRHSGHPGDEVATFRELLTEDCLEYLRQRSREFSDMDYYATGLIDRVTAFSRLIRHFFLFTI